MSLEQVRDKVFALSQDAAAAKPSLYRDGYTNAMDDVMEIILDALWEEGDE